MAIPEWVMRARHGLVVVVIVEQAVDLGYDAIGVGADEERGARLHPSGRSVVSRITSTGLPSAGASSCTPPESVKHQMRARQQADEVEIFLRRNDLRAGVGSQPRAQGIAHIRVRVHRQDDDDIGPFEDALESVADLADAVAEILPAVTGGENDLAALVALGERGTEHGEAGVASIIVREA